MTDAERAKHIIDAAKAGFQPTPPDLFWLETYVDRLTPTPEPAPPLDEIAEIAKRQQWRHRCCVYSPEENKDPLPIIKDVDTLLRLLRSRTFGVDKEALAKWLYNFVEDMDGAGPTSDAYMAFEERPLIHDFMRKSAQALIDSGLLGGSIGNAP